MKGPRATEDHNDGLTDNEKQQLEDGLRILARIIARAVLEERSLLQRSQRGRHFDSAERPYHVSAVREPNQPLTVSIREAAKTLGLSRHSVYAGVRAGHIPRIGGVALAGILQHSCALADQHRQDSVHFSTIFTEKGVDKIYHLLYHASSTELCRRDPVTRGGNSEE